MAGYPITSITTISNMADQALSKAWGKASMRWERSITPPMLTDRPSNNKSAPISAVVIVGRCDSNPAGRWRSIRPGGERRLFQFVTENGIIADNSLFL